MLLIPRALVLHTRCQPEGGLGGPSMTHSFSRQMILRFGFLHDATSECCSQLLSLSERELVTLCDRGVC